MTTLLEPDIYRATFAPDATPEEMGRTLLAVYATTDRPILVSFGGAR